MARPKKQTRAKEPVRLRFKELNNGNKSLYLDIYQNGKRKYEFLKLYLVPGNTAIVKAQNDQVMTAANAIKSQRIIELSNNEAGISSTSSRSRLLFCDWLEILTERKRKSLSENTYKSYVKLARYTGLYGDRVPMQKIDKDYCLGFIDFLRTYKRTKKRWDHGELDNDQHLKESTQKTILQTFNAALNAAVRDEIMAKNPYKKIDNAEKPNGQICPRGCLTIDELRALIDTPACNTLTRKMFLFACFTGLRWSDLIRLKWNNLEMLGGRLNVKKVMQKTKQPIYLPLSAHALEYLPERSEGTPDDSLVFAGHVTTMTANRMLAKWAAAAGITKEITFHTSRHTFATISLTLGADLYTVSKLLGHTSIATTQIYAEIVNQKKDDAVDLFDKAF